MQFKTKNQKKHLSHISVRGCCPGGFGGTGNLRDGAGSAVCRGSGLPGVGRLGAT